MARLTLAPSDTTLITKIRITYSDEASLVACSWTLGRKLQKNTGIESYNYVITISFMKFNRLPYRTIHWNKSSRNSLPPKSLNLKPTKSKTQNVLINLKQFKTCTLMFYVLSSRDRCSLSKKSTKVIRETFNP